MRVLKEAVERALSFGQIAIIRVFIIGCVFILQLLWCTTLAVSLLFGRLLYLDFLLFVGNGSIDK